MTGFIAGYKPNGFGLTFEGLFASEHAFAETRRMSANQVRETVCHFVRQCVTALKGELNDNAFYHQYLDGIKTSGVPCPKCPTVPLSQASALKVRQCVSRIGRFTFYATDVTFVKTFI
jgi:hypothetical protein